MVSNQKNIEPSEDSLLVVFQMFDKEGTGKISEVQLRKILSKKFGEDSTEIDEMMLEYGRLHVSPNNEEAEQGVEYREFVQMLQM